MDIDALKNLIKKESRELEFKSTTAEIHKACKTICAFLNGAGGIVLIGVKNDGRVIGQMITDSTLQEIANDIRKIEPPVCIDVNYIRVDEQKSVIQIDVSPGEHLPYVYDGRPYHRVESETVLMPQHLYEQMLVKRGQLNHAWDDFNNNNYVVEDLDPEEILKTVQNGIVAKRIPEVALQENTESVLTRLKLLKNGKLKNAAIILYAKDMDSQFAQYMIRMARFKGVNKLSNFIDNQQFYGSVFKILNAAANFMEKHLHISSTFSEKSFARSDKFTLPVFAVREALINSICHRSYQNNSTLSLAIFDVRMELWNSGFLPKELNIEDLKFNHESYPRNKLLAKTLYKLGLIEQWGNCTLRVIEECRKHGIPDPIFEEYSSGLLVKFIFSEPIGPRTGEIKQKFEEMTRGFCSVLENLSNRKREIIDLLKKHEGLKSSDIMKLLNAPPSNRTLKDDLLSLKKLGLIDFRGRARSTIWYLKQKH